MTFQDFSYTENDSDSYKSTSKYPFLLTIGKEHITIMHKIISRQSPVRPAAPPTHPNPVRTEKKYFQIGKPLGVRERRTAIYKIKAVLPNTCMATCTYWSWQSEHKCVQWRNTQLASHKSCAVLCSGLRGRGMLLWWNEAMLTLSASSGWWSGSGWSSGTDRTHVI